MMPGNSVLTKAPSRKTTMVVAKSIARISTKSLRNGFSWITMLYQVVMARMITASVSEELRARIILAVRKYGVARIIAVMK